MEHSAKFETVKSYYERGLWTAERIRATVGKWITEEEADEILHGGEAAKKCRTAEER